MKVATISRKRNLMKFTKYSYTFKTAKIANKNYKYITNIIANKLQKEYSHTPFSLCNSKIFNYRYICNYFHREKKHYTIHVTKIIDSKLYFDHNYSSNPVVLKDIHIYMYLFCGRPCRRPVDGADVNFWLEYGLNADFTIVKFRLFEKEFWPFEHVLSYDFDGSDVLELEYEEYHLHFEKLIDDDAKSELWEIIHSIQGE